MRQILTQDEQEFLTRFGKAPPERRFRVRMFLELAHEGDSRACEILMQVGNHEITPEKSFVLLDDYLASRN